MATKTKKRNSRVYRLYKVYGSGYDAKSVKAELRKKGKSVRIIEEEGVRNPYALYVY
jgi:hypothetical protein